MGNASRPAVSLFLMVKDGMPFVRDALDSVCAQTFRDFELVIQDGASTDGTLEYLRQLDGVPELHVDSRPDSGVSQAANRATSRCRAPIVGSIDADNRLEPDALERAVEFFEQNPRYAAAYGGVYMIDKDGGRLYPWMPAAFDLLALLGGELVPPFSVSFFRPHLLRDQFWFDETLRSVPDFDLWLRISDLPIGHIPHHLGSTRLSDASSTRRPEEYEKMVAAKLEALDRFIGRFGSNPVVDAVRRRSAAGHHLWAAESILDIEGPGPRYRHFLNRAADFDAHHPRLTFVRNAGNERQAGSDSQESTTAAEERPSRRPFRLFKDRAL